MKGQVYIENQNIFKMPTKLVAKKMAILPQIKNIPTDITVRELVSYGRYPHLKFGQRLEKKDYEIIDWAIERTRLEKFKDRHLMTLSGGEQQRAWLAMSFSSRTGNTFIR